MALGRKLVTRMQAHTFNFAHQDLRNRSFRGQHLPNADFRGADLRGCDFSKANLHHADFRQARLGQSRRQHLLLFLSLALAVGLAGRAVSHLVFAALGQTPADRAWHYVVVLYLSLSITSIASGGRVRLRLQSRLSLILGQIAGLSSAALLGFFYGGSLTTNHLAGAIGGASLLSLGVWLLEKRCSPPWLGVAIAATAVIAGYGLTFSLTAAAAACWFGGWLGWGLGLGLLTLAALGLTIGSIWMTGRLIQQFPGTSFHGANLTQAQFDATIVRQIDCTGAIGPDPP